MSVFYGGTGRYPSRFRAVVDSGRPGRPGCYQGVLPLRLRQPVQFAAALDLLQHLARTAPEAKPAGQTAVRTKPVRITVDLDPADYTALNRWIESAAIAIDPDAVPFRRLSQSAAVRAMIDAAVKDTAVTGVVLGLLRQAAD